jgi:hypothetical protein
LLRRSKKLRNTSHSSDTLFLLKTYVYFHVSLREPARWAAGSRLGLKSRITGHGADGMRERREHDEYGHRKGGNEAGKVSVLDFVPVQHDWILLGLRTGAKIGPAVCFINGISRCSMFWIPEQ